MPILDDAQPSDDSVRDYFSGKIILVTGGTGTIGLGLIKKLMEFKPRAIRLLTNDENSLFETKLMLERLGPVTYMLGDVREIDRVRLAIRNADIVYHVAALKHIDLCERNPFEAVKTNVIGTQNMLEASLFEGVEKFMFISTDKAMDPSSTLGATKLLCERLTIDASSYRGTGRTIFSCVRFGNVLGSRGSVFHVFLDQIRRGGPVTLTHPDMTRFIMLPSEAIQLILKTTTLAKGGEIFILKMPAINVADLANVMIEQLAPRFNIPQDSIELQIKGARPGEKMHERLMTEEELLLCDDLGPLVRINFHATTNRAGDVDSKTIRSETAKRLSKDEIRKSISDLLLEFNLAYL